MEDKHQGQLCINFIDIDQKDIDIQIENIKAFGQKYRETNAMLDPVRRTVFA